MEPKDDAKMDHSKMITVKCNMAATQKWVWKVTTIT